MWGLTPASASTHTRSGIRWRPWSRYYLPPIHPSIHPIHHAPIINQTNPFQCGSVFLLIVFFNQSYKITNGKPVSFFTSSFKLSLLVKDTHFFPFTFTTYCTTTTDAFLYHAPFSLTSPFHCGSLVLQIVVDLSINNQTDHKWETMQFICLAVL